jgi:hypothetical protein
VQCPAEREHGRQPGQCAHQAGHFKRVRREPAGRPEKPPEPRPALAEGFKGFAHARIKRRQDVGAFIHEWPRVAEPAQS